MPMPVRFRRSRRFPRRVARAFVVLPVAALAVLAAVPPLGAQFVSWETLSVPNPFSVTAAVRGVPPAPAVKLEGLVGFAGGAGNQFVYHATPVLVATSESPGLRSIDTGQTIDFADFGVQSAFDGRCCSNNALGLTDDTTLHAATNFGAGTSSEFLIGVPQLADPWTGSSGAASGGAGEPEPLGILAFVSWLLGAEAVPFFSEIEPEGTISFRRVAVGSDFPAAGLAVHTIDGPVGTAPALQLTVDDCLGVSSSWHFTMDRSDALDESYVACVKTNGNLVVKRIELDPDQVTEIPLVAGVGTTSAIFAYLHVAACPISTGTVVGTVIPRQSLGTTTFFATYLSAAGAVVGTSQVTLPGARANHQAFFCRPRGDIATFVYHGTGQNATTTTDTFVVEAGPASLAPPTGGGTALLVRRVTENRRTDWADAFPDTLYTPSGQKVELDYRGLEPVAEIRNGTSSNVRYGGIPIPIFFHNFESGDLRFFSLASP